MARVKKYGIFVESSLNPVVLEIEMVRRGGQFPNKKTGQLAGNGLLFHFCEGIKLIWPEISQHRWFTLFVEEWLRNKYIGIMGPKNSGKSLDATICHLFDYYCFPSCTTTLICSTTKERLEDRIWGEIKKFHRIAQSRFRWLPGHLIEGRQRLVTDDRDESSEGRDFRNGMIGVPCFLSGTMVDTPLGRKPIESVKVGDMVVNASGIGMVSAVGSRIFGKAIRVKLRDGRAIDCTPDHPFFTKRGWVNAGRLLTSDMVLSGNETMRLLWENNAPGLSEQEVLQSGLSRSVTSKAVQVLRQFIPAHQQEVHLEELSNKVLLSNLRLAMGRAAHKETSVCFLNAVPELWKTDERGSFLKRVLLSRMQESTVSHAVSSMRESFYVDTGISKETEDAVLRSILQEEGDWSKECASEGYSYQRGAFGVSSIPSVGLPFSHSNRKETQRRPQALVSNGHCVSGFEAGCGGRWWNSPGAQKGFEGYYQDKYPDVVGVDRVEVLERGGDSRFSESEGGYRVYNLEVEGHPSYSVNGVIVHNCKKGNQVLAIGDFQGIKNKRIRLCGDELAALPKTFIDAIATLDAQADVKVTGMGNPADTTDALGVLCEPAVEIGGWEGGIDQTLKTKTWRTKMGGICIQFPGSDSPNNDEPDSETIKRGGPLYPFLITKKQMDDDAKIWGKDDWHFTMFNEGRMPRGQGSRRVITKQLCVTHRAMEQPIWLNSNRTSITFLDAAYRAVGGDRCVFGELQFGYEAKPEDPLVTAIATAVINQEGENTRYNQILALVDMVTIPIRASDFESPEDQIVMFVKDQHEKRRIPPENFFFDAGMRTSLVTAFGRLWTPKVNSIDFGGKPTERKVSADIDVSCRDYYSKFVTELWYSVRLVIEAGQFRGMTNDVMMEGCSREWKTVAGNKIEVETKVEMKEKTGRSPDLFDALCAGVEGARQRGFIIKRLGKPLQRQTDNRWKKEMLEKAKTLHHAKQLNYAA